jgi:hypothetical protein
MGGYYGNTRPAPYAVQVFGRVPDRIQAQDVCSRNGDGVGSYYAGRCFFPNEARDYLVELVDDPDSGIDYGLVVNTRSGMTVCYYPEDDSNPSNPQD